ncbi:MAG: DUF2934 domain-containing protein [Terriglobales bacterium]
MARKKSKTLAPETSAADTNNKPLSEQIAALAHALWCERGCPQGSPEEDWYRAEQEIREQRKGEIVTLLQHVRGIGNGV